MCCTFKLLLPSTVSFSRLYQRWLIRQWLFISAPCLCLVPRGRCKGLRLLPMHTQKWVTLISRVEFSFLKILWRRFPNLTESGCERHCSEWDADIGWKIQFFLLLTHFAISYNVPSVLSYFPITSTHIFWAATCILF